MNTYVELINKHKGEDCFILASGPSLFDVFYKKNDYIDIFKNNVVIAVNASVIACVEHLGWLSDGEKRYWISDDSLTTKWSWWSLVKQSTCVKICRNSWLEKHSHKVEDFLYFSPRPTKEGVINKNDIGLTYSCSTSSAIDLAIQFGSKNIYIIGLDHVKRDGHIYFWEYFKRDKQPRQFEPGKPPWRVQQKTYDINMLEYEALNQFAKSENCNIYNCNISSNVESFEKIEKFPID